MSQHVIRTPAGSRSSWSSIVICVMGLAAPQRPSPSWFWGLYIYMCIYIYTYTYTYIYTHIYTQMQKYACMYVCMHVCMYVCMHACMYVYIYTHPHTHIHRYVCICTHTYMHMSIYMDLPSGWGGIVLFISSSCPPGDGGLAAGEFLGDWSGEFGVRGLGLRALSLKFRVQGFELDLGFRVRKWGFRF